jgi:hypothetical protein
MKQKRSLFIAIALIAIMLLITACAGAEGPAGPAGPAGPEGPAGADGAPGPAGAAVANEWAGKDACAECHQELYDSFMLSGHPYKLNAVVDGQPPTYPFTEVTTPPEGYTWDDISYVIGGYNWKARFVDLDGYIITGDENATTQYNFYNEELDKGDSWVGYHAGEENKPYNCGVCHTSGYQPEGNQDGLPGLIGTWEETGITCEECHGPSSLHVADPYGVTPQIVRDSDLCGECHIRGDETMVDAKGGFIKHHEQYEELFQSKHLVLDCVTCHDPHGGVIQYRQAGEQAVSTTCENCHFEQAKYGAVEAHAPGYVTCTTCHMPKVSKSALGDADRYRGDIMTHLMAIDADEIGQFTEDGAFSKSQLSLDFTCRQCHNGFDHSVKTDEELLGAASDYHTP